MPASAAVTPASTGFGLGLRGRLHRGPVPFVKGAIEIARRRTVDLVALDAQRLLDPRLVGRRGLVARLGDADELKIAVPGIARDQAEQSRIAVFGDELAERAELGLTLVTAREDQIVGRP